MGNGSYCKFFPCDCICECVYRRDPPAPTMHIPDDDFPVREIMRTQIVSKLLDRYTTFVWFASNFVRAQSCTFQVYDPMSILDTNTNITNTQIAASLDG